MKKRLPIIMFAITAFTLSSMVSLNVLDTFVFTHEAGQLSGSDNFSFDDSGVPFGGSSSQTSSRSTKTTKTKSSSTPISSASIPTFSSSSLDANHTTVEYISSTYTIKNKAVKYHLARIQLKRLSDLRTMIATNSSGYYGSNITQKFGTLIKNAEANNAPRVLCAISGEYPFWQGKQGYVVRNGTTYRETVRTNTGEDLAIFKNGQIVSYLESEHTLTELKTTYGGDIYQNFSFGPTLVLDGQITVTQDQEIDGQTMSQNERTAIGFGSGGVLYFLATEVNGDRNSASAASFSLYTLASFMQGLGCFCAYNLDGGASSAFYFNGGTTSYSSDGIRTNAERNLGDIIYVVDA